MRIVAHIDIAIPMPRMDGWHLQTYAILLVSLCSHVCRATWPTIVAVRALLVGARRCIAGFAEQKSFINALTTLDDSAPLFIRRSLSTQRTSERVALALVVPLLAV
jgi:hypothetical protein